MSLEPLVDIGWVRTIYSLACDNYRREILFLSFIYLFIAGTEVEPSPLLLRPFIGLLHQPWMVDADDYGAIGGMNEWQGKPMYSEETFPSAAQTTTDPIRPDLGSKTGRRGGKPGD
jgi:hypothetical protein